MDRPRVVRLVRVAASAVCLALSALLVVLWLRNFWRADVFWGPAPGGGYVVVASADSQLELAMYLPSGPPVAWPLQQAATWGMETYAATPNGARDALVRFAKVFRIRWLSNEQVNMIAPYWFVVLVTWMLAAVPWIPWSTRYSIRTMLIVTTFVAVGLAIWTARAW